MVIDSSALIAILLDEPERLSFVDLIQESAVRLISVASVLETSIVLSRKKGPPRESEIDLTLRTIRVDIRSVDSEQLQHARSAFRLFGKGRHPAGLNFGDCFSYALAKAAGEPLLFKGDDFSQTDITSAI